MGNAIQPAAVNSQQPAYVQALDQDIAHVFHIRDDMNAIDDILWSTTGTSSGGTTAVQSAVGGIKNLVTTASSSSISSEVTSKIFSFNASYPVSFRVKVACTEGATDQATVWAGLTDTTTTGGVQANGAGPLASSTSALWYKSGGSGATAASMFWYFGLANAGATTSVKGPAFTSGSTYTLGFDYNQGDGVTGTVTPWIKNETTGILTVLPVMNFTIVTSPVAMAAVRGVNSGGAVETLQTDWIDVVQLR